MIMVGLYLLGMLMHMGCRIIIVAVVLVILVGVIIIMAGGYRNHGRQAPRAQCMIIINMRIVIMASVNVTMVGSEWWRA